MLTLPEGKAICPYPRRPGQTYVTEGYSNMQHSAPVVGDQIGHHYLFPGQTYVCPGVGEKV
jgi:hypothetical protein